jgi:hypothetical protein
MLRRSGLIGLCPEANVIPLRVTFYLMAAGVQREREKKADSICVTAVSLVEFCNWAVCSFPPQGFHDLRNGSAHMILLPPTFEGLENRSSLRGNERQRHAAWSGCNPRLVRAYVITQLLSTHPQIKPPQTCGSSSVRA